MCSPSFPSLKAGLGFFVFLLLQSCKAKSGDPCKPSAIDCADEHTALVCNPQHVFEPVACRGPKGCHTRRQVVCDGPEVKEGQTCVGSRDNKDLACSVDHKQALLCKDGIYAFYMNCRGPKTCLYADPLSGSFSCDNTTAELNDRCIKEGAFSCSVDHKQMFVCANEKWGFSRNCRGPKMCTIHIEKNEASCDMTISQDGDPCGTSGMFACSFDQKSELVCRQGKFEIVRRCRNPGCVVESNGGRILCEPEMSPN